jgi:hypothetical protein
MAAASGRDKALHEYSGRGLFIEAVSSGAMETDSRASDTEQDWRLEGELNVGDPRGALHELVGRFRGPDVVREIEAAVPHDVVITHDGRRLFAYAAKEATIATVRAAIEGVLSRDGITASLRVSRWDEEREEWLQTDPPPSAEETQLADAARRDADAIETRTLVATSGKMIRAEFEQSMRTFADDLGLECDIIEHPHLLRTQVAFTVTGPKHKIDEFSRGLVAEGWATIRGETTVLLSPL